MGFRKRTPRLQRVHKGRLVTQQGRFRMACETTIPAVRLNRLLAALGVSRSTWYRRRVGEPKRRGRRPVPEALARVLQGTSKLWTRDKRLRELTKELSLHYEKADR